ncbi:uncharacterized protein LOC136075389 isoform X2 [Hydra vulgaris]|uniref:Uncharacterized protein LOC136075389 isoform X2 n=1 Tax=Hydra vulgaris TaxID=6087 RepID=A0ABM4B6I7_HYDVU
MEFLKPFKMSDSMPKEYNIFQSGEFIQKISERIGVDWKKLGRYLGVHDDNLDTIEEDANGIAKKAVEMIKKWRQINDNPTIEQLCAALEKIPRKDIIPYVKKLAEDLKPVPETN